MCFKRTLNAIHHASEKYCDKSQHDFIISSNVITTCIFFLFNFSLTIVESIPENLTYSPDSPMHPSTYQAWLALLAAATTSVDIASYYWTLRGTANVSDVTDNQVMSAY